MKKYIYTTIFMDINNIIKKLTKFENTSQNSQVHLAVSKKGCIYPWYNLRHYQFSFLFRCHSQNRTREVRTLPPWLKSQHRLRYIFFPGLVPVKPQLPCFIFPLLITVTISVLFISLLYQNLFIKYLQLPKIYS